MIILMLFAGFVLLVLGAEALVRGASSLAAAIGVSPLVIGLTIVAYGTSSPEMAVTVISSFSGQADIALGNVVGSNIFNTFFILGVSAFVAPLVISPKLMRLDVPLMIVLSILTFVIGIDGLISRMEGSLLLICAIWYTFFLIRQSRYENHLARTELEIHPPVTSNTSPILACIINIVFILIGLGMLVLGSRWLVDGAVSIAHYLGVSEIVIGLTIVAAGTSLPELATSVLAGLRRQKDIAVGNIVGSNIFNILNVLGLAGIANPEGIGVSPEILKVEIPIMIIAAVICLPIFYSKKIISRREGILLLSYYLAFTGYLILDAMGHPILPLYIKIVAFFYCPVTLLMVAARAVYDFYIRILRH